MVHARKALRHLLECNRWHLRRVGCPLFLGSCRSLDFDKSFGWAVGCQRGENNLFGRTYRWQYSGRGAFKAAIFRREREREMGLWCIIYEDYVLSAGLVYLTLTIVSMGSVSYEYSFLLFLWLVD